jgi:UDPglucose 6-dehydrogenase/GDP-mannose 6-dehydrogenase
MKIAVVGTGYVGLVSGVCLAAVGHDVTCVDLRKDVVESLNAGTPHIHEEGLPELLGDVLAAKRFRATLDLETALEDAVMVLIAVGTPSKDGRIDLHPIREVSAQIGRHLKTRTDFLSVVVKSTVVPSTTDTVVQAALEEHSGLKLGAFGLGMNPEFLREGNAIEDFMQPDRVVLGYEDDRTRALLEEVYRPWQCDKLFVNTRTAETIKYANNALLATQISAVNEIANLCYAIGGIDVKDVMQGVHLDKRWSPITPNGRIHPEILTYLIPGCGFGGSCFPKDVQALRTQGQDQGLPMQMLQAVLDVNDAQPSQIIRQLETAFGSLQGRRILVLGLAFKPGTDDVRESASLRVIRQLAQLGAIITAHDPIAAQNAQAALQGISVQYVQDWLVALEDCEGVIVATKWPEYDALKQPGIAHALSGRVLVDARRMFHPSDFAGAQYHTIGWRMASKP